MADRMSTNSLRNALYVECVRKPSMPLPLWSEVALPMSSLGLSAINRDAYHTQHGKYTEMVSIPLPIIRYATSIACTAPPGRAICMY